MPHRIHGFTAPITGACACLLIACSNPPPNAERRPTVRELRSRNLPATAASQPESAQPIRLLVQRLDIPLSANLDKTWALVHTQEPLSPESVRLWKSNGLRVGLLPASDYHKFVSALPPRLAVDSGLLISRGEQVPLHTSAPIDRPRNIQLATPDGESTETLPVGTPQFIIELLPADGPSVLLYLMPQHHFVRSSIAPRSPLEIELDGRIFHELTLEAELDPTHILVVAWSPPPPPPEEVSTTAPAMQPATQPATTKPVQPTTRPSRETLLGDLLLTAQRLGQPTQRVLLFGLPPTK